MKSNFSIARLLFLVLMFAFSLSESASYSQHEIHFKPASFHSEEYIFTMQKISLSQPVKDTIVPTICNSGKGLVKYEILLPRQERINIMDCKDQMSIRQDEGYTESELKALQEQKRRMLEQQEFLYQQQLIKERLFIDLEGIIRGINTPPMF